MKKRILSLLLAVVMVMSFIPPVHVHAADECSAGGEHDWSYSNYGSCYRQCSKCYSSGYVDHDVESWSVSTSFGSKQHSGTCKNCKDTISGYCSYSYGGEYGYNATNHWQLCTVCGEAASRTNKHSLSTTSNGDGTHAAQCSTCGYTNAGEPCDYQYNWMCESNASGHTLICPECNHESALQQHTMGYKKYSNSQHYYCCTVCSYGQSYSSLQNCTFNYKNDGATHTATCKDCGNVISGQSHTFKNGFCACGAEKHDHAWKLTASGNQIELSCTGTGTCDVTDKGTLTITAAGGTYDGNAKAATVSRTGYMENNGRVDSVLYYKGNSYLGTTAPKDVGNYTAEVTYWFDGKSATAEVDFTISKANLTVTATGWEGSYDGAAHGITVDAGDLKVTYNGYFTSSPTYTDAGTYTVTYEVEENSNYNITNRTGSADVKISKVDKTVTATGWEGDYDGNAHGITVNAPEGLTVEYSTTGNEYSYSSYNVPTFTDAGTYTVYYRVTGNENYNIIDGTGSADVKINKANKTVTATGWEGEYDGNAHGITVNAPEGVTVTYCDKEDGWYSSTNPTYKDAGTYTVYYKATAGKNYSINGGENTATGSAVVQINQTSLEAVVKATPYSGTYDGKPHGITVEVPDDADVYYKTTEDGEWSSWPNQNPTFTDVGDYTVYYKVVSTSGNYTAGKAKAAEVAVEGSSTVKITPLDLATVVTAEDTEFTFNRNEYTSDPTYTPHSIKLEVDEAKVYDSFWLVKEFSTDGGATWSRNNPTFRDAGTYEVNYRVYVNANTYPQTEDDNYVKAEGKKKVTINKAELPVTGLVGYHGPYDGSTHYGFGYKYSTSYGDYFTLYWYNYLHKELNYSFSWKDESGTNRSLVVEAGEEPKLTDFPGFTKQNVVKVDSSKDTDASYGTHKVTVTIGSDNYNDKTFDYYVQIGPGGATAKDTTFPYDGTEHYIANYIAGHLYYWGYGEVYNFGSIKIEYREKGSDTWLPASQEPGQTEVGYKNVEWRVTMDSDQNGNFGEEENSFGSPEIFTGTNRVTVTQAELTATAGNKTITYGDPAPAYDVSISGFVASEDKSVLDDAVAGFECSYKAGDDVGTYTITPNGLNDNNYSFKYVPGTLTVEPKSLPIEYDGTKTGDERFSVDDESLLAGDKCEIDTVKYFDEDGKEVTNPTEAGTYTAKFTLTGEDAKNYIPLDKDFTIQPTTPPAPDTTAPTGNINVTTHNWTSFLTGVTFDIYFKEGKAVTLTADDDTGVESIQYFVSNTEKTPAEVKATTGWNTYTTPFTIVPDQKAVVYVKITDVEGNVAYICSNGMVFDGTPPKIDGVEDGGKYKKDTDFTVKDDNLDKVTVDGKEVKPDKDGNYTIKNDGKKHTIVATDKAGNKTEVTIKMTKAAAAKDDDSPASGDTFNLVFWGAALVLSMAALVLVIVNKRKFFRAGGKYGR